MSKWSKELKKYEKYMQNFRKKKNVQKSRNYSSFWWDDDWSSTSRFSGLNNNVNKTSQKSNNIVKLIKLNSYQRAIANFVKIVTKKDIPVVFGTNSSFTDGKRVTLASDISDSNFDVAVGLALHEGSHIILTDFEALPNYLRSISNLDYDSRDVSNIKTIVNIIEDRRIDNYVFKSSPGYRAYYHKMYDHYFNDDAISKALVSGSFRDPKEASHYIFRLTNITNPLTSKTALPGFEDILNLIDLKNIGRLKSTHEVIELALLVLAIIKQHTNNANNNDTNDAEGASDSSAEISEDGTGDDSVVNSENLDGIDTDDDSDVSELSYDDMMKVQKAYDKQKRFLNGDINKKSATKKLQQELENVSKLGLDVQMVGDKYTNHPVILYDLVNKQYLRNVISLIRDYDAEKDKVVKEKILKDLGAVTGQNLSPQTSYYRIERLVDIPYFMQGDCRDNVVKGFELGALLGRKLMVRNEERTLVHNRLVSGKIDSKRLSHAGYGLETVFKQVHTDKYKQACLHISLDISGSMSGSRFDKTVQMCSAIVKAATYVQNLRIQVSVRATENGGRGDTPFLANIYDSKFNDLKHYMDVMSVIRTTGCTPEGLCFDAMMKRNLLLKTSSEQTSYFLNISDGEPGMGGWGGTPAREYTRKQVQKMKNEFGINVLSFFVDSSLTDTLFTPSQWFIDMYGKDSKAVSAKNVTQIARALNDKFLAEGKYSC